MVNTIKIFRNFRIEFFILFYQTFYKYTTWRESKTRNPFITLRTHSTSKRWKHLKFLITIPSNNNVEKNVRRRIVFRTENKMNCSNTRFELTTLKLSKAFRLRFQRLLYETISNRVPFSVSELFVLSYPRPNAVCRHRSVGVKRMTPEMAQVTHAYASIRVRPHNTHRFSYLALTFKNSFYSSLFITKRRVGFVSRT